jgi:hypothetical protein
MKKIAAFFFVFLFLALTAFAQLGEYQGRLSPDDQKSFDSYYRKWVEAIQTNNQAQTTEAEKHMQEVMGTYAIPTSVPYDAIATSNAWENYKQYRNRLSRTDQAQFDSYYQQWLNYKRLDNREDILRTEGHMQDLMQHYDIPRSVPYAALTTIHTGNYGAGRVNQWQGRLSVQDQSTFDDTYVQWLDACRKNDHKAIVSAQLAMQNMMRRYNIPSSATFDQLVSPSVAEPPYSDLKIVKATYGSGDHAVSVTSHLQHLVQEDKLHIVVNDDTMGGSPGTKSQKALTVSYSIHGSERQVTVPESGKLSIP